MNPPALIDAETGEILSEVRWDSVALHIPEGARRETYSVRWLLDNNHSYPAMLRKKREPCCVVYFAYECDRPVYVGATAYTVRARVAQHRQKLSDFGRWVDKNIDGYIHSISAPSRAAAIILERTLIDALEPSLNVR